MPFGSKKSDQGDLDSKKSSLFGKSSNKLSKSPQPPTNNPYAVPAPSNNPYATQGNNLNPYATAASANDPYARSQSSLTQPPTSSFGSLTLHSESGFPDERQSQQPPNRYEKSPAPPAGYGGPSARFQAGGSYGQGGGYGSDPYGNGNPQQTSRQGGYGGMGRRNSQDTISTDAGRNALFGDAPKRAAQPAPTSAQPYDTSGDASYSNAGGYGSSDLHGGYGSPAPDRELTAEEQEEEDVNASKQEIRFIKQQDISSTRNARRIAEQSEQIGRDTLARLGAQGERIHNTERNLDLASSQNVLAEEKARELKTLNRSMFAVHVANPFTAKKREQAANNLALERNRQERETRDATQAAAFSSTARAERQARDLNGNLIRPGGAKNLAERAKYQFEADSEDEEMENEIDENL